MSVYTWETTNDILLFFYYYLNGVTDIVKYAHDCQIYLVCN